MKIYVGEGAAKFSIDKSIQLAKADVDSTMIKAKVSTK